MHYLNPLPGVEALKDVINENIKQLYSDLQREYDLILDRRKSLTSQAQNLLSFGGIIQTVLIALIVALATNKDARALLVSSPNYTYFLGIALFGFASYIATIFLSLLAFREPKWSKVPDMPDADPLDSIDHFFNNPAEYDMRRFAHQLSEASRDNQKTNDKKYLYLKGATCSLIVGIIATIAWGMIVLFTAR